MTIEQTPAASPIRFSIASISLAALALIIAVAHLSLGPFTPQKPVEQTIADTAVKIKEAAKRAITGEEKPEPVRRSNLGNLDKITDGAVLALAGCAILLAIIALARREQRNLAFTGFSLGTSILFMAWLQWIALMICGMILLAAIVINFDEILS